MSHLYCLNRTFVDEQQGILRPTSTLFLSLAFSGFLLAKFFTIGECATLSCSLVNSSLLVNITCIAGWGLSLCFETFLILGFTSHRLYEGFISWISFPFLIVSICTALPNALQVQSETSHEYRCETLLCRVHDTSGVMFVVSELVVLLARRPVPSWISIVFELFVVWMMVSFTAVRELNSPFHKGETSTVNRMFGAFELLGILISRTIAYDSLQMRQVKQIDQY